MDFGKYFQWCISLFSDHCYVSFILTVLRIIVLFQAAHLKYLNTNQVLAGNVIRDNRKLENSFLLLAQDSFNACVCVFVCVCVVVFFVICQPCDPC